MIELLKYCCCKIGHPAYLHRLVNGEVYCQYCGIIYFNKAGKIK